MELYRASPRASSGPSSASPTNCWNSNPSITDARVGGRAEAPGLLTVLADGLSLELTPVTIKRSTLLGCALIALDVLAPGVERVQAETGPALRPDPVRASFYDQRQAKLDEMYRAVAAGGV